MWLAAPGAVRVGDDELFFVTRTNTAEGISLSLDPLATGWESEIAMGRLRKHGLVSLDAPYSTNTDAAVLTTKPLIFRGKELVLNLNSAGGGSLMVEVRLATDPPQTQVIVLSFVLMSTVSARGMMAYVLLLQCSNTSSTPGRAV
jgi:hypothetical protein